jgi:hypothetical protein
MLQLSFRLHLSLVLQSTHPEWLSFMVEHFLQLVNHSLIAPSFVFLTLNLSGSLVYKRALRLNSVRDVRWRSISSSSIELRSLIVLINSTYVSLDSTDLTLHTHIISIWLSVQFIYIQQVFLIPIFLSSFLNYSLIKFNLLPYLCILFLLHYQLLNQQFSVVFLLLIISFQLLVLFH